MKQFLTIAHLIGVLALTVISLLEKTHICNVGEKVDAFKNNKK